MAASAMDKRAAGEGGFAISWLIEATFVLSQGGRGLLPFKAADELHADGRYRDVDRSGARSVHPNAILWEHIPAATTMPEHGVLYGYWGLVIGFGVFALLLVVITRGRLGYDRYLIAMKASDGHRRAHDTAHDTR